jgi:hypothetical protein
MQDNAQENSMKDDAGFHLSRIRAEGWNAALKYLVSGNPGDQEKIAALNPYRTDLERSSWHAGFNNAVEKL